MRLPLFRGCVIEEFQQTLNDIGVRCKVVSRMVKLILVFPPLKAIIAHV